MRSILRRTSHETEKDQACGQKVDAPAYQFAQQLDHAARDGGAGWGYQRQENEDAGNGQYHAQGVQPAFRREALPKGRCGRRRRSAAR